MRRSLLGLYSCLLGGLMGLSGALGCYDEDAEDDDDDNSQSDSSPTETDIREDLENRY